MDMKARVVEMLEHTSEIEKEMISILPEDERSRSSTYDDWSIKDQLAHCAVWKDRLARDITVALQGITPTESENYEQVNQEIFEEFHGQSWEEVLSYSERAKAALIEAVRTISNEDLVIGEVIPSQSGRELWKVILSHGYTHPLTHYSQVHLGFGNRKYAREIQEEMNKQLMEMDDSPSWQSIAIYNLACFYAQSGDKERAISGLKKALELNSALMDWSKQDPDFENIREDPEYLVLYDG